MAVLTGVTLLSWWLGLRHEGQALSLNAGITVSVLLIAALKVRVIVWEFMELRHTPTLLRRLDELNIAYTDLNTRQSSLEEIFVGLVGGRRGVKEGAAA